MTDFIDDERLDGPVFEETFKESQQKSVKRFCDDLNPRNVRDKPFVVLCQTFKKFGIDASEIAEGLQDNEYFPFLNPLYVAHAIMFEEENVPIERYVETHGLDLADFIRYTIIHKKFL